MLSPFFLALCFNQINFINFKQIIMKKKILPLMGVLSFIIGTVFMAIPDKVQATCKKKLFNNPDICINDVCTAGYDGPKCNAKKSNPGDITM